MPNDHPAMCLFLTVCFLMCHHFYSVTAMRILKYSSKLLLIFFYFYGNYLSIENVLIGEKGKRLLKIGIIFFSARVVNSS